ncbi:MAG: hypothetical protein HKN21_15755 [Candidatus Eisenbacteria bacterium]|uniref:Rubredoxin-like domain-containing protein n=1 Tax=Eiseniibacteriota bacterium TaxID=2212470 RepID=A0A7Y2EAF9_UNCEI|nr:hypothetical protein [Candidatus Eisenbacteria bacterium]
MQFSETSEATMWTCQNCGYSDETGETFESEFQDMTGETVRYCPECGSDEVFFIEGDEPIEDGSYADGGAWEDEENLH